MSLIIGTPIALLAPLPYHRILAYKLIRRYFVKLIKYVFVLLALCGATSAATASVFNANFDAAGTGGNGGYYYFVGHQASETYLATGLTSVDELTLTLNLTGAKNYASQALGFTFSLNNVVIGTTTYGVGDESSHALDFNFGAISSLSGDWTLLMAVSTQVCSGCGAVEFGTDNPLGVIENQEVPEPASIALMGLGLAGLCLRRRRSL
jgi:hypothetical protein